MLTEEVGEPLGLVVVHDGDAERVEGDEAEHGPVEGLSFDHAADVETHPALPLVEKGGVVQLGAFEAGAGEGGTWRGGENGGHPWVAPVGGDEGDGRGARVRCMGTSEVPAESRETWGAPKRDRGDPKSTHGRPQTQAGETPKTAVGDPKSTHRRPQKHR